MYGTPNATPLSVLQRNLNTIAAHAFQRENPFFVPFKHAVHPLKFPASPQTLALPSPQKGEGEGTFFDRQSAPDRSSQGLPVTPFDPVHIRKLFRQCGAYSIGKMLAKRGVSAREVLNIIRNGNE